MDVKETEPEVRVWIDFINTVNNVHTCFNRKSLIFKIIFSKKSVHQDASHRG